MTSVFKPGKVRIFFWTMNTYLLSSSSHANPTSLVPVDVTCCICQLGSAQDLGQHVSKRSAEMF
eukprot:10907526-Prorocentrum_lima.AAC.1